jgi:hypothetical protein
MGDAHWARVLRAYRSEAPSAEGFGGVVDFVGWAGDVDVVDIP